MPLYVRNVNLALDEPEELLQKKLAAKLKVPPHAIRTYAPVRRSLDARKKPHVCFTYCLEVALDENLQSERKRVQQLHRPDVELLTHENAPDPTPGQIPLQQQPIIVGFGPAGMFAAYQLAQMGYRPIVLERGQPVKNRHRDILRDFYRRRIFHPESNLLFGEGGAGTYSDGKLYTRLHSPMVRQTLQIFYEQGANPNILIDGRPHIGSDRLPNICMRIRRQIQQWGGEIRFGARFTGFNCNEDRQIISVQMGCEQIPAQHVLLAIGHSARDTIRTLAQQGVTLQAKPFQLGVRIEHPQSLINCWQYGAAATDQRLPPADYHLVARQAAQPRGDLFSFCMCPGGTILPSNESANLIATNGASRANRSGPWANSGLVITIDPQEFNHDPLQGLQYQQHWESLAFQATGQDYAVPAQRARDFLQDRNSDGSLHTSYPLGGKWHPIRSLIPDFLSDALKNGLHVLDQRLPGFAGPEALITAPETRASAPLRILRNPHSRQSVSTHGLWPIGEGAGYAGGIVSAAIDGLKSANLLISQFAPPR